MSLVLSCLRSKAFLAQRTVLPSVAAYSSSPMLSTKKETVTTMDVVRNVAETHDLSVAESRRILDTVFDTITDAIVNDKHVTISKFGSFTSRISKSRQARNPRTQEVILVPEKKVAKFKPYETLKKVVNHETV